MEKFVIQYFLQGSQSNPWVQEQMEGKKEGAKDASMKSGVSEV